MAVVMRPGAVMWIYHDHSAHILAASLFDAGDTRWTVCELEVPPEAPAFTVAPSLNCCPACTAPQWTEQTVPTGPRPSGMAPQRRPAGTPPSPYRRVPDPQRDLAAIFIQRLAAALDAHLTTQGYVSSGAFYDALHRTLVELKRARHGDPALQAALCALVPDLAFADPVRVPPYARQSGPPSAPPPTHVTPTAS